MAQRKIVIEMEVSPDFNASEFFDKLCNDQQENYPWEMWEHTHMSDSLYPGGITYTHEDSY